MSTNSLPVPQQSGETSGNTPTTAEIQLSQVASTPVQVPQQTGQTSGGATPPSVCIFRMWEHHTAYKPLKNHFLRLGPYNEERPHYLENVVQRVVLTRFGKTEEEVLEAIHQDAVTARECYEGADSEKHHFPELTLFKKAMVRDGCFILEFMHIMTGNRDPLSTINTDFSAYKYPINGMLLRHILLDMLFLTNQIPMVILRKLHGFFGYQNQMNAMLNEFLEKYFVATSGGETTTTNTNGAPKINFVQALHLLDAARIILLPGMVKQQKLKKSESNPRGYHGMSVWYSAIWYSALDLKDGGIKIIRANEGMVEYSVHKRILKLPAIRINRDSGFIFSNMVAFEQRLEDTTGSAQPISSYLRLLNDLLRTPADVRALSSKRVIINNLGPEDDVIQFFKELKLQDTYGMDMLSDTRKSINSHLERRIVRSKADLFRNYFRSPWALCSVIAAGVLLILTTLQVIYAMLAYHHPPS